MNEVRSKDMYVEQDDAPYGLAPPPPAGDLIVFDEICLICSGFARFMAHRDHKVGYRFVSAQSETGRAIYREHKLDPDLMETNIVIRDGRVFLKMAAFTEAMRSLGWPWRLFAILDLLPTGVADWLYDRIAQNRYRLGRRICPIPSRELMNRLVE